MNDYKELREALAAWGKSTDSDYLTHGQVKDAAEPSVLWDLLADLDAARADAARYRTLCETSPGVLCFAGATYSGKKEFDAAIDKAMKTGGANAL